METLGKQRVRIGEKEPDQVVSVKLKIAGVIDDWSTCEETEILLQQAEKSKGLFPLRRQN